MSKAAKMLQFDWFFGTFLLFSTIISVSYCRCDFEELDICDSGSSVLLSFAGKQIQCGQRVSKSRAASAPEVTLRSASKKGIYILLMVDPDAPKPSAPTQRYWLHWMVANIKGDDLESGNAQGEIITDYSGPSPPRNSGQHRYQTLVFEQPSVMNIDAISDALRGSGRGRFDVANFADSQGLCGHLMGAFQFLTEA